MDPTQLRVARVGYRYRGQSVPALSDVSFTLEPGVTGLVGVNGAGKTTLLSLLARVRRPDHGTVVLDGHDVHRSPRASIAPLIGHMPQEFSLPERVRVIDAVSYLAWLKGLGADRARATAEASLTSVGLGDRAQDRLSALSGGMLRRVALAQSLASDPELLLLDEPTTGLDPEQRAVVRGLLTHERYRDRITVMSSHVMEDIEHVADRVLVLDHGELLFAGTLADFCLAPDGTRLSAEAAFLERVAAARPS